MNSTVKYDHSNYTNTSYFRECSVVIIFSFLFIGLNSLICGLCLPLTEETSIRELFLFAAFFSFIFSILQLKDDRIGMRDWKYASMIFLLYCAHSIFLVMRFLSTSLALLLIVTECLLIFCVIIFPYRYVILGWKYDTSLTKIWGPKLYENDVANRVRDYFTEGKAKGVSTEALTTELIIQYKDIVDDENVAPMFWFALAETQWQLSVLIDDVKIQALECLPQEYVNENWNAFKGMKRIRQKTLRRFEKKMNSAQPRRKVKE